MHARLVWLPKWGLLLRLLLFTLQTLSFTLGTGDYISKGLCVSLSVCYVFGNQLESTAPPSSLEHATANSYHDIKINVSMRNSIRMLGWKELLYWKQTHTSFLYSPGLLWRLPKRKYTPAFSIQQWSCVLNAFFCLKWLQCKHNLSFFCSEHFTSWTSHKA